MSKVYDSILDTIGNTPIVKLNNVVPANAADVYVKLEFFNPAGSVKDRVALAMIQAAEEAGKLTKGGTIIEPTSGNTGIGLATVVAAKGYPALKILMSVTSKNNSAVASLAENYDGLLLGFELKK